MNTNPTIFNGLKLLKHQQDLLCGDPSDVFSDLLVKLARVDTLPFVLYKEGDPSPFQKRLDAKGESMQTFCFRIENLNEQANTALVSFLHPFDIYGETAAGLDDLYLLKRTAILSSLPLNDFAAVKCLDIEFMKREIIIEPKW
ncbi:hypothetical protein [Halobacillus halophilus]|uniref:hypothetical protein n=1 Tax=Halobacillus halophilus TaxID=1570 RepID=UPI001CD3EBBD|nr:hypothetical protein [Halobacillus halophilus]MCA1011486.1 hypothetical protein [Halobacillus halophilus]